MFTKTEFVALTRLLQAAAETMKDENDVFVFPLDPENAKLAIDVVNANDTSCEVKAGKTGIAIKKEELARYFSHRCKAAAESTGIRS